MNLNETCNWDFLKDLQVGEYMDLGDINNQRTSAHVLAARVGIKVKVNQLENGDFRITRLA